MDSVSKAFSKTVGVAIRSGGLHPVAGGCINRCFLVETEDDRRLFVKSNQHLLEGLFEAEAFGLRAMDAAGAVRVPKVIGVGSEGDLQILVLEAIPLRPGSASDHAELGRQLAAMHRQTGPGFGFEMDNYIGELPQANLPWSARWPEFYRDLRLLPQLRRAAERGLETDAFEPLLNNLDQFFRDYAPRPALLHGDLWGGNADAALDGGPVIYDPACYYGDREADLAMTELFGGFQRSFYEAYEQAYPVDSGYPMRRDLYNLYHILNHYNHFGGAYGEQSLQMAHGLRRKVGWV